MFIRSGQEADVMMYFADGPFVAERFILRYRGGVWVDLFARCLVIDEGHFTFWVDFDLVPERAELAASFGEGDLDALDLARWLDGPFRRLAPTLDQTERANLIESVATALGVDINLNADDDDDEWDPDDDWEPEEPWDDDARVRGIVKFFDPEQRFGFIVPADGGADVFFHASDVAATHDCRPREVRSRARFRKHKGQERGANRHLHRCRPLGWGSDLGWLGWRRAALLVHVQAPQVGLATTLIPRCTYFDELRAGSQLRQSSPRGVRQSSPHLDTLVVEMQRTFPNARIYFSALDC
jgi:cold shock CspA family protein